MKVVVFVEGEMEQLALPGFLKRWLDPRLRKPIGVQCVSLRGSSHAMIDLPRRVNLLATGSRRTDIAGLVSLFDLYELPFRDLSAPTIEVQYERAKAKLEAAVAHARFRAHFAVHETEAWLLAEPAGLPAPVRSKLPAAAHAPETVNCREPPAKLLRRLYRERMRADYRKVIDGADLFRSLDPDVAAARCPLLRMFLDDLLTLAST